MVVSIRKGASAVVANDRVIPVTVFDRLANILGVLEIHGRQTLSQVTHRTKLPRSSVHRMLEQLTEKRWISKIGHEYELGIRLLELGFTAVHQNRLYTEALPFLNELHRITGMVVNLGVLDRGDVIYLGEAGGPNASRIPTRVGGRYPAYQTAIGRTLLAFAETPWSDDHWPLPLRVRMQKIRETGVSHEPESPIEGLNCITVPIGPPNRAIAALSICGPASNLKLIHDNAVPLLIAAAAIWDIVRPGGNQSTKYRRGIRTLHSMATTQTGRSMASQAAFIEGRSNNSVESGY